MKVLKRMMKRSVDRTQPEEVKKLLAVHDEWSANYENVHIDAHTSFLRFMGRTWNPPKYAPERELPFIPLEKEIDVLIAGCSKKNCSNSSSIERDGYADRRSMEAKMN